MVADGTGILLNDEMDDFSAKPGVANMFGVVGSDANAIAPKKRPLSSMSPTIMTKDGKVSLVIGTPGGSRIFTSIFQVINNIYDFNMPLKEAVARDALPPPVAAAQHDLLGAVQADRPANSRSRSKRRATSCKGRTSAAIFRSSRSMAIRRSPPPIRAAAV